MVRKSIFWAYRLQKFRPPPLTNKAPWMSTVPVPLFQLIEHCKLCKYIYNMSRLLTISCRNVVYLQHVLFADHQLQECWGNESNDTVWGRGGGAHLQLGTMFSLQKPFQNNNVRLLYTLTLNVLLPLQK